MSALLSVIGGIIVAVCWIYLLVMWFQTGDVNYALGAIIISVLDIRLHQNRRSES